MNSSPGCNRWNTTPRDRGGTCGSPVMDVTVRPSCSTCTSEPSVMSCISYLPRRATSRGYTSGSYGKMTRSRWCIFRLANMAMCTCGDVWTWIRSIRPRLSEWSPRCTSPPSNCFRSPSECSGRVNERSDDPVRDTDSHAPCRRSNGHLLSSTDRVRLSIWSGKPFGQSLDLSSVALGTMRSIRPVPLAVR